MFRLMRVARVANALVIPIALVCLLTLSSAHADYSTPAQTVWLDDQKVRYHLMGDAGAPVAIVLGGGPGFSSWNLEPVQRRLAELGYRTAIMDMIGVGENANGGELPTGQALLDVWVEQIEALRRAVTDERPVVLLGHSWGALTALLYTRTHPDAVHRLVLLNPVDPERRAMRDVAEQIDRRRSRELGESWDDERAWEQPMGGGDDSAATARHQIERSLPSYFRDYAQGQRYAEQFDDSDFSPRLNIEGWRAYRADPVDYATIREWDIPIDVIGCRDDLLMPESLDSLQANLSLARVEVLTGCVHFPWEEVPGAFTEALTRIVSRPAGQGAGNTP
ncbi:alpha/beta fold hydrolase [Guyparkeria sp. SCN-R1]|uniref:alpha/beta fold hydrolase n=1 Tax=Guyparkeria sp. SCN-R1 TaxID=2341113 RepID=UPI0010008012|nr:alpha/beta fold hydrolase [Guyparkeria sp. SCN-R1]RRQ24081.1 alpha/beta fold hydrolase [Guyparkeria sp. SCN-R1]